MIGNDIALDPGIGTCGKNGQGVPVGVGQPSLRMDRITVGGTGLNGQLERARCRQHNPALAGAGLRIDRRSRRASCWW